MCSQLATLSVSRALAVSQLRRFARILCYPVPVQSFTYGGPRGSEALSVLSMNELSMCRYQSQARNRRREYGPLLI